MFGEGLTWEESVPAQVGAMMGTQSANLAVHGFGTDQAYLRLQMELARFRRPVAVVSLFMTALFGRNLDRRSLAANTPKMCLLYEPELQCLLVLIRAAISCNGFIGTVFGTGL